VLFLPYGCQSFKEKKKYVVGLSQCMLDDAWRKAMIRETLLEASNYDDLEVVIRDANSNNEEQIRHIRELIAMKVDVLIISPFESEPITPVAEEAFRAGIPTIITDRKVNTELYTTFVGANNYEIGLTAGAYAAHVLPENACILEIWGLGSSSPAQERHQGFAEALKERRGLRFIPLDGEWRYDTTCMRIARMQLPPTIDFVYAHNDMMAIAAREFFMQQDSAKGKQTHIIGVDAVPEAGLEAVADGRINASFMYPTGGEQVIRAAMDILRGKSVAKFIPLESAEVDKSSARTLLLQTKTITNYQQRIEQQRSNIDYLSSHFRFLENSLLLISLLMTALVVSLIYVFRLYRKLIALNTEIKEVTAQKLQFFTNVSHELRTPLSLILSPLHKLAGLLKDTPYFHDIQLMQKNSDRLLRVINQLLDFRKLENSKETLAIRETDMVAFAGEVKTYFDSIAEARGIAFGFHAEMRTTMVWIDTDKMEKVLLNLLSNAFKFTPDGGRIQLRLSESNEQVCIEVEDNGRGIRLENIPFLFDRFYTGNSHSGTGIGLHLVKEYIRMHHGEIKVNSAPGAGTTFTVSLHKDKSCFSAAGYAPTEQIACISSSYDDEQLDDSEEKALLAVRYDYTILLVDDDREVLAYLEDELKANFSVRTATNGKEALETLQTEDVSLTLSDVMMPEMNGFDLCRTIKSSLPFSHIPVILLTALSGERQKTFAISGGADDYIQKPFHVDYVKLKIIRLMEERKRLREQLLAKLQDSHLLSVEQWKVESIDDLFLRKFIANIEKVYKDAEFNVEKLSDALAISRGHLHRKVKGLTGVTPVDFLRNYRLRKAAVLLMQQQLSISEIAYETGFTSPAYFSKCFKVLYHITPKEYRKQG
jgi:signal transduction histidine kinase/DNA-binding response OmpR family regulator/DNA-binding LacI/PurR family transcriptional regulator